MKSINSNKNISLDKMVYGIELPDHFNTDHFNNNNINNYNIYVNIFLIIIIIIIFNYLHI